MTLSHRRHALRTLAGAAALTLLPLQAALATADQFAAKQAVFGIDTALKALKEKKAQKDLPSVVETQVVLVTK